MTITLNGTTGITLPNGSASAPAATGSDTDTGIVYGTNTVQVATGGTTAVTVDSSQNVGIGTSSPVQKEHLDGGSGDTYLQFSNSTTGATSSDGSRIGIASADNNLRIQNLENAAIRFDTNGSERMRIDSAGQVYVKPSTGGSGPSNGDSGFYSDGGYGNALVLGNTYGAGKEFARFTTNGTQVGSIVANGTTNVSYNTSSDYRLKENIAPMIGALAKVSALKPCTYTWKVDGSQGQGFIAHELQAVVPECVTGEKDAVETYIDDEGLEQTRPKYQAIDTSFLVATLTAAIQEQQAIITDLKARIETLENK